MGAPSTDWKWGNDFLPAMSSWLQDLEWLPVDDTLPQGHGHVSFMELALDFETHAGKPLPPTPQFRFAGTELSLEEKGKVVRLAVTLMGKRQGVHPACPDYQPLPLFGAAAGRPGGRSEGVPLFHKTHGSMAPSQAPAEVQCERWAQQQQSRVAKQRQKRRRA